MKYHLFFWGSLFTFFFFYSFTVPQPFTIQYIYILYEWMCMCCRIHVLCTTWFVISPIQLQWTKPSPPNNKYKAQDPCFYLGLGTIKKRTHKININIYIYIYIYIYVCMYVWEWLTNTSKWGSLHKKFQEGSLECQMFIFMWMESSWKTFN